MKPMRLYEVTIARSRTILVVKIIIAILFIVALML